MPINGYFNVPFAQSGSLTPVPDDIQSNGSVSYEQGYGILYSTPVVQGGINYPRAQSNQILNDVTVAIQFQQQNGASNFITDEMNGGSAYSYKKGATVMYDAGDGLVAWISVIANNEDTPGASANWQPLGVSAGIVFTGDTSTGAANAQAVVTTQGNFELDEGNILTFTAGFSNTTTFTLAPDSVSATAVKKAVPTGLADLAAGDIVVGNKYVLVVNGAVLQVINPTSQASQRTSLTGNLDIYVATTGNDSNTGLTIGSPFLTIQHAWDVLERTYDLRAQYTATIHIADGTYTAGLTANGPITGAVGPSSVIFSGNTGTPANVIVAMASGDNFTAQYNAAFSVTGMKLTNSASGNGLHVLYGGQINFSLLNFGAMTGGQHINAQAGGGSIVATGNYTISGGAAAHLNVSSTGCYVDVTGVTVTISGTPAFSAAFADCAYPGMVNSSGVTWTGSATGVRYNAIANGVVNTQGSGATYFPGNASGTTSTGGQYV